MRWLKRFFEWRQERRDAELAKLDAELVEIKRQTAAAKQWRERLQALSPRLQPLTTLEWKQKVPDYDINPSCPENLRDLVVKICLVGNIHGKADPMYIANMIALESGCGDGRGQFSPTTKGITPEQSDRVARKLQDAFGVHFPPEFEWILVALLHGGLTEPGKAALTRGRKP